MISDLDTWKSSVPDSAGGALSGVSGWIDSNSVGLETDPDFPMVVSPPTFTFGAAAMLAALTAMGSTSDTAAGVAAFADAWAAGISGAVFGWTSGVPTLDSITSVVVDPASLEAAKNKIKELADPPLLEDIYLWTNETEIAFPFREQGKFYWEVSGVTEEVDPYPPESKTPEKVRDAFLLLTVTISGLNSSSVPVTVSNVPVI